jgi:hypothetical protein
LVAILTSVGRQDAAANRLRRGTTTEDNMSKIITIRAKAFTNEGVRENKVMVDGDTISVWDSVAGHYTTCHSLSKSAISRARKMAS